MSCKKENRFEKFAKELCVEMTRVTLEVLADMATAQTFMTVRKSVTVTNISQRTLDIESRGKKETLRVTITNPQHLHTIIEAMKSGKKLDLTLTGEETRRKGTPNILTAKIAEVKVVS